MAANKEIDKDLADALKAIELMEAQARLEKNAALQNGVQRPAQPVRMTPAAEDKKKKEETAQEAYHKKKMSEAMKEFIVNGRLKARLNGRKEKQILV